MPRLVTEGMGSKWGEEKKRKTGRKRERGIVDELGGRGEINAICLIKLEPVEGHKACNWWRKESIQCRTAAL